MTPKRIKELVYIANNVGGGGWAIDELAAEIERLQAPLPEDLERRLASIEELPDVTLLLQGTLFLTTTIRALQAKLDECSLSHQEANTRVALVESMFCETHLDDMPSSDSCIVCQLQAELAKERGRLAELKDALLEAAACEAAGPNAVAPDKVNVEKRPRHDHLAVDEDDACQSCGLDLWDEIHFRLGENKPIEQP